MLHIYGDSFADNRVYKEPFSWPNTLQRNLPDVRNFAHQGTGLKWAVSEFIKTNSRTPIEEQNKISVLILLSSVNRFNYKHIPLKHQGLWATQPKMFKQEYGSKEQKFFEKVYKVNDSLRWSFIEMLSTIAVQSKHYKKIMIWPIFDDYRLIDFSMYERDNLIIQRTPLSRFVPANDVQGQNLQNHLNLDMHNKMITYLTDWVNDKKINLF
jgi:hypothetical protein